MDSQTRSRNSRAEPARARGLSEGRYPEGGFQSSNALSKEQTLRGMTQWVALAQFQEADLGTIEIGKWADLTWMDRNWLNIAPADVLETRVLGTCIAGEWLYLAER